MVTIGDVCPVEGEIKFEFEWKISNFYELSNEPDISYSSPEFNFCGVPWKISIYPNGQICNRSVGWVSLFVTPVSITTPVTMDYSLSIKMANGIPDMYSECTGTSVFQQGGGGWGSSEFIHRGTLFGKKRLLLPSGSLTVICKLRNGDIDGKMGYVSINRFTQTERRPRNDVVSEFVQTEEITLSASDLSKYKVFHDFKDLFLKQTDCDVILKVKGRNFKAHKAFLKARSPVFYSTFRIDMKEKRTGIVEINDCDPSAFSDFLCFLYCGEVENLATVNVFSLFTIADKYDVADLRSECLKFMKENITVDNFCDTMSLALLHSEADLIKLSSDFFAKNVPKILVTVKWQLFIEESPSKSNELLIKALVLN